MFQTIRKILALLSPKERIHLYLQCALLIVTASIDMIGIASILPFMAVVSKPDVIQTNQWLRQVYDFLEFTSLQSFLFFLGMVVLGLLVFGNLVKGLFTWISLKYDNQLNFNLARRLLASYMARPYEFFLNTNTAEMSKNVLSEAGLVIGGILSPGMQLLSNVFLCLFVLALLMVINPFVAVAIIVVLGGIYGAIYLAVRRRLVDIGKEQSRANFMKFRAAAEALSGIKELRVLGRENTYLERFAVQAQRHARHNTTVGIVSQLPRYALETVAFGGILLIVLYSLEAEQQVERIIPLLSVYAFAGYRLMPALQQIFASVSAVRVNLPAVDMLHRDMDQVYASERSTTLQGHAGDGRIESLPLARELVLEHVTFRYRNAREPAVDGVHLAIAPNTSVGFVGATGSGKTTTVDIILGLLKPVSGRMLVDGVEIHGDNLARWQRNLGYVPQHIYLSDDTVTRNIAFGVPENEIDMQAVARAARIANLQQFIERELPHRYETIIGERGVRLSGGQRQRIGIARALYRDPAVLIMDEGTSALDGVTEEAVMEALRVLSGQKTIIMIAHRLSTVKCCNVIYLMENGRIAGHGTYDELLESSLWFQAATRTGT